MIKKKVREIRDLYRIWREYERVSNKWKELDMDKPLIMSKTVWGVILAALATALSKIAEMLQGGSVNMMELATIVLVTVGAILAAVGGREAIGKCMK